MPIDTAFIFAAGLGKRMLPLTLYVPKPMVKIAGTMLIEHALRQVEQAGVRRVVVNSHHLADQLDAWLMAWHIQHPDIHMTISDERDQLLETAGGIIKALPLLGTNPFFTINGDVLWKDRTGAGNGLFSALNRHWDPDKMDMLLALCPREKAFGYEGSGDFSLASDGTLRRDGDYNPYVYCGIQIIKPSVFKGYPIEPFSLRDIYHARKQPDGSYQRMAGVVYDGDWLHVGTVADIAKAEIHLASLGGK